MLGHNQTSLLLNRSQLSRVIFTACIPSLIIGRHYHASCRSEQPVQDPSLERVQCIYSESFDATHAVYPIARGLTAMPFSSVW
jgi:hypothetical protein